LPLTSDEHFTVGGTLLEAWASAKSFQPKAGKQPPPDDGALVPSAAATTKSRCSKSRLRDRAVRH